MKRLDRLSALMSHFELLVVPAAEEDANLWVLSDSPRGGPSALLMGERPRAPEIVLAQARVDWGGMDNPFMTALPAQLRHSLRDDPETRALVAMFLSEINAPRCGSASVLNRLGEVLVVRLLRAQIAAGTVESGLLAALADPRLSRAVVAMHNRPDYPWRLDGLAAEAGLSPSRFSELFRNTLNLTPLAYLRGWRLVLARQEIEKGARIQQVARRYCYGSPEALSRAVSAAFGKTPLQLRKAAREAPVT